MAVSQSPSSYTSYEDKMKKNQSSGKLWQQTPREFVTANPSWDEIFQQGQWRGNNMMKKWQGQGLSIDQMMRDASGAIPLTMAGYGTTTGLPTAYTTLNEILLGQGKTDPAMYNRELAGIGRDTQSAVDQNEATLARLGLSGSTGGILQGQAIRNAGASRLAGRRAQESLLADERKRQDLNLVERLYLDPIMQMLGIERGVATQKSALDAQRGNQMLQMLGIGLGAVAGGPIGASIGGAVAKKATEDE